MVTKRAFSHTHVHTLFSFFRVRCSRVRMVVIGDVEIGTKVDDRSPFFPSLSHLLPVYDPPWLGLLVFIWQTLIDKQN